MADNNKSAQKRSAARAKPARAAAGSVRRGSVAPKDQTAKEATAARIASKAQRNKDRADEERVMSVANILAERHPDYAGIRRVWWALLIGGAVSAVITLLGGQFVTWFGEVARQVATIVTTVFLILAYILIFAAFIYDWRKLRPIRKDAEAQARSMTEKRQQALIAEFEEAEAQERAVKRAAKRAARGEKM